MKVIRYSDSGTTHMNGTLAMFWVMWLLIASSITEPIADNESHWIWVPIDGLLEAASLCSEAVCAGIGLSRAALIEIQPVVAQTTTKPA